MVGLFEPEPDPRAHLKVQPSLFNQRQVKPADPLRYQRGYTPERMQEVRQATEGVISVPRYGEAVPPAKQPCPTCGGQGHSPQTTIQPWMRQDANLQQSWAERGGVVNGGVVHWPGQKCWTCGGSGQLTAYSRMTTGREMSQTLDHPFYTPHGGRMIQEAIARSTIPTEHLEGLQGIELEPVRKVGMSGMADTYGLYTKNRRIRMFPVPAKTPRRGPQAGQRLIEPIGEVQPENVRLGFARKAKPTMADMVPVRSPTQRQKAEGTLIHEIGHHVSLTTPGRGAGAEEEARADRYMMEHWRPDPRDVRQQRDINMQRMTYMARLGGPYTRGQYEQTEAPTPAPKKRRRRKS